MFQQQGWQSYPMQQPRPMMPQPMPGQLQQPTMRPGIPQNALLAMMQNGRFGPRFGGQFNALGRFPQFGGMR